MINQFCKVNLVPKALREVPTIDISQYDEELRTLSFMVYNGETLFEIPEGSTVTLRGTKPDNTGFEYECVYNGSIVTLDIKDQISVCAGRVICELRIVNDGILGTANVNIQVKRSALSSDIAISETDLPMVEEASRAFYLLDEANQALENSTEALNNATEAISDVDAVRSELQGYVASASGYADNASQSANNSADSASLASTKANDASGYATSASNYANNASQSASNAQTYATNASNSANSASNYATNASNSANDASTYATNASNSANEASGYADDSKESAEDSEAWAVGTRNGVDVPSTDITYNNNAKYYTNTIIDLLLANDFSWGLLKQLVKAKQFKKWFNVGDQFTDPWKEVSTGTEYNVPWNVTHIDENENVFLQWDYATPTGVPFDEPEAVYYFDGTESAGTYEITIGITYGTGWVKDQVIAFTLASAPSADDQFVINLGANNANNPIGRTWNVYAKGSTVSKQSGTTFNGDGTGINLGTIGSESAQKPNGRLNAISRACYGSNRWSQSAMRQYLNADTAKGNWWSPQNGWDRPVGVATTLDGFLYNCSEDFKNSLDTVEVVTALNTTEGYSATSETTLDKIFIPSLGQMYINPQLDVEGEAWDYYKNLASEAGLTGRFAQSGTYPILISYNMASQASPVAVRLRSAIRGNASSTWYIYSSGYVSSSAASYAYRPRPACKLLSSE